MRSTTESGRVSFIEVMIVCAIIGVLAAIAQTAYDAYASQVRADEPAAATLDCKAADGDAATGRSAASSAPGADSRCDSATRRIQDGLAPLDIELPATGGTSAARRAPLRARGTVALG